MEVDLGNLDRLFLSPPQCKRRKISLDGKNATLSCQDLSRTRDLFPTLQSTNYFTDPSLSELATREYLNPGYCSKVLDFTVGRYHYGCVKFMGETDVRWLGLDHIIKFRRHEVVVYEDESAKPAVGQGLNKAAEVTLVMQTRNSKDRCKNQSSTIVEKLRLSTERQGADFLSFNPSNGEWKFLVQHFSRFGLNEDDEEVITMDVVSPESQNPLEMNDRDIPDIDEETSLVEATSLSHSLPAHLGLDPVKMKEMKMLIFPAENEEEESNGMLSLQRQPFSKESLKSFIQQPSPQTVHKESPPFIRKTPLALVEYNPESF